MRPGVSTKPPQPVDWALATVAEYTRPSCCVGPNSNEFVPATVRVAAFHPENDTPEPGLKSLYFTEVSVSNRQYPSQAIWGLAAVGKSIWLMLPCWETHTFMVVPSTVFE